MNDKTEFSRLLHQSGMTLVAAAEMLCVTRWTVMNWRDGKTRVPATAMDLMRAVVWQDVALQRATITRLEADLAAERRALAETERRK